MERIQRTIPCRENCDAGTVEVGEGIGGNGPVTHLEACPHCKGTGDEPCWVCKQPAVWQDEGGAVCAAHRLAAE